MPPSGVEYLTPTVQPSSPHSQDATALFCERPEGEGILAGRLSLSGLFYLFLHLGVLLLTTKLYVGNLSYAVNSGDLEHMFATHGTVHSAKVIMDRVTGRSRGFGFVEMDSDRDAQVAISALHGKEMAGRNLTVNEAKPHNGFNGAAGMNPRRNEVSHMGSRSY